MNPPAVHWVLWWALVVSVVKTWCSLVLEAKSLKISEEQPPFGLT